MGSLTLPLIPLSSPYQFRIFRWPENEIENKHHDHDQNPLPITKHFLAESGVVQFKSKIPGQVHLAFTDHENEMRVMFVSWDGEKRFVRYGFKEGEMDHVAVTKAGRYEREDMCDSPANESVGWRDPGWVHDGVMTGLDKGKRYFYQVGSDSKGWSKTHSFVSRNKDSDETIAFLFGDMGTSAPYNTFQRTQDESVATMKWIARDIENLGDKPSFVSHIGDISYARGYLWVWDHFFNQIEPVASKVPYHVCIGNHEYDWPAQPWKPNWAAGVYGKDGGGECGVPYSVRFNMPGNSLEPTGTRAPPTRNLYYSFNTGSVHFLYFSTETKFLPGSKQYEFIKRDLETVDRAKTPFVVVQGHRPMYTTSHENRDAPFRAMLLEHIEPLLVENNVNLALWGHVHRYERFCPLNNYTCGGFDLDGQDSKGYPTHVVIGMAGQDWQPIWEPRDNHPDMPVFPQPSRSLYRGGEYGYTRLVANKGKLVLSYVGNHDGEVHDSVEILASGQVFSGIRVNVSESSDNDNAKVGKNKKESTLAWYVKGSSVILLGAFLGYIVGYLSHSRKGAPNGNTWTPVKSEEV